MNLSKEAKLVSGILLISNTYTRYGGEWILVLYQQTPAELDQSKGEQHE